MKFSLHRLARSPRLRALAALAWLMLLMHTVAAAPMIAAPAMHASVAAMSMPMAEGHAMEMPVAVAHAGCGDGVNNAANMPDHACHCAAMSGSLLLPLRLALPPRVSLAANYARPTTPDLSPPHTAPPLRPPTA